MLKNRTVGHFFKALELCEKAFISAKDSAYGSPRMHPNLTHSEALIEQGLSEPYRFHLCGQLLSQGIRVMVCSQRKSIHLIQWNPLFLSGLYH
jgi:hypothetical protein